MLAVGMGWTLELCPPGVQLTMTDRKTRILKRSRHEVSDQITLEWVDVQALPF